VANDLTYYFKHRPARARKVRVRVGHELRPADWCRGLEGSERDAVEIHVDGERVLIDDVGGAGWRCVSNPHHSDGYSRLPPDSIVLGER
jgi:hypothetical protein